MDNVFTTANTEELVVICNMDPGLQGLGTDHVPILTTLDISVPKRDEEVHRNFRETDWDKFRKELGMHLCSIPGPCAISDKAQFQRAVNDLTKALQMTIEAVVPLLQPSPHSHRWWSKDLSWLKREMNRLASQSYKYRAINSHPVHGKCNIQYGSGHW